MHDRFIAYLATHAPLEKNGRIQRREENRERWRSEDIAMLVMERFEELDGCVSSCFLFVLQVLGVAFRLTWLKLLGREIKTHSVRYLFSSKISHLQGKNMPALGSPSLLVVSS